MRPQNALRAVLAVLFVAACVYQARHSWSAVGDLVDWRTGARAPFRLQNLSSIVSEPGPEARGAGLEPGDRITAIDGIPLAGGADLDAALGSLRAGGVTRLSLADGRTVEIPVVRRRAAAPGLHDWSIAAVLQVLMPAFCLLLGFWVAALRPRDPIAWLLLALMMSFSLATGSGASKATGVMLRDAEVTYESLWRSSWPIWMMLFGIYFPERLSLDRRWPWAKWLLIAPVALGALATAWVAVAGGHRFALARPVADLIEPLATPITLLGMLCISVFFAAFGMKTGMTQAPDARRRLRLLFTGATVGLTPMFLVVVTALLRGADPFTDLPPWIVLAALLMLFLFPLSLAYVIVVHRALDVRVVIRQGLQYAFARQGLVVLRFVLWAGVLVGITLVASRPNTRRVDILRIVSVGGLAAVLIGRVAAWLIRWTDRKFFREACDAEQVLNDLAEQVRTMVEVEPLLRLTARRLSESLHVPRVAILLSDGGRYRVAHALGFEGPPDASLGGESAVVARMLREHEPLRVYLDDPDSWAGRGLGPAERSALERLGSQLLLPIAVKERLPGFISLGAKLSEEPYSATDLRLLRSVSAQVGLALENSRLAAAVAAEVVQRERLNREVEIAREVQERLFPQALPAVAGLDYSGRCRPALRVGGDYFDFLKLEQGLFGVAIADVSGKGIGAALLMASLQASLRGQTIREAADLGFMVGNVNRLVYDASPDNRYATFFYGQYDPVSRDLAYVNAGHCPPLILRSRGEQQEMIRLKAGGTVVGLFPDSAYAEGRVTLRPGDLFVAWTDGISEALNPEEEEWGEAAVAEVAARCREAPAAETLARIMEAADAFAAGADQHDDMTLVVMRVL